LDADDVWLPEKLEAQIAFMIRAGVQFCFARYRIISQESQRVSCLVPMRATYRYRDMLRHRGMGTLTVMIERELLTNDVINVWLRAGGEELMWWLLILRKGVTAHLLDMDLARYRDRVGSLSKNQSYTLLTVWDMYHTKLGLSAYSADWHYASYILDVIARKMWLKLCGALTPLARSFP
jgi:teichuronic acid biosynthesis glycosyltransferase TuaG